MLCQIDNLPSVVSVMAESAIDRLHYRVRFSADHYAASQIRFAQRGERVKHIFPARLPLSEQFRARLRRSLEFRVAVAVGLFTVASQEISPARAHIAMNVLHDDGDRV